MKTVFVEPLSVKPKAGIRVSTEGLLSTLKLLLREMQMRWLSVATTVLLGLSVASPVIASPDRSQPLEKIDVADYRGRVWTLDDFRDADLIVVTFLGTECPLAKLYAGRLQDLQQRYADKKVAFIGVMSNRQDSIAEISAFARRHEIEFPLLKDAGNRFADQVGAERTPEVFVFDSERKVRYWGRIDDQYGIGYVRDNPESLDLQRAIDELIAGKEVSVPETRSVGCIIGRQKQTDNDSEITFTNQVARIINRRCVGCHREGEIGPFALTDYDEAAGWADMIAEVVREGRMPPWHASPDHGEFLNDRTLTDEEKETLYAWASAGAPQGDPSELPPLPEKIAGWQLPREPDLVLNVSPQPFQVPAEGAVSYKYFVIDPELTEDRWVLAAELLPGNPLVVHHILCFARPKGERGGIAAERSFLFGYVPGARVEDSPPGYAKRIPADSELIFQVHYTPIGTDQTDHSKLGIVFADPAKITHEIVTYSVVQPNLRIQPHDADYRVEAVLERPLPESELLSMSPHMHLRGKSFRYELIYPDGKLETLLDVPAYDFNWQTSYVFSTPMKIPAGAKIKGYASFDNSEKNLNNPDPSKLVRWGDQTDDEMMIGYFHYAVPLDRADDTILGAVGDRERLRGIVRTQGRMRIFLALDRDGDGQVVVADVPERIRADAAKLDRDGDGILTKAEVELADANARDR